MQIALVTCGVPGIGKSTWADAQSIPIVSPDRERARLGDAANQGFNPIAWQRVRDRIEDYVASGKPPIFIVDGTFAGRPDRKSIMRTIGPTPRRVLVVFPMDRARAHGQNQSRQRVVSAAVVDHFIEKLEQSCPKSGRKAGTWFGTWKGQRHGRASRGRLSGWTLPKPADGRPLPSHRGAGPAMQRRQLQRQLPPLKGCQPRHDQERCCR